MCPRCYTLERGAQLCPNCGKTLAVPGGTAMDTLTVNSDLQGSVSGGDSILLAGCTNALTVAAPTEFCSSCATKLVGGGAGGDIVTVNSDMQASISGGSEIKVGSCSKTMVVATPPQRCSNCAKSFVISGGSAKDVLTVDASLTGTVLATDWIKVGTCKFAMKVATIDATTIHVDPGHGCIAFDSALHPVATATVTATSITVNAAHGCTSFSSNLCDSCAQKLAISGGTAADVLTVTSSLVATAKVGDTIRIGACDGMMTVASVRSATVTVNAGHGCPAFQAQAYPVIATNAGKVMSSVVSATAIKIAPGHFCPPITSAQSLAVSGVPKITQTTLVQGAAASRRAVQRITTSAKAQPEVQTITTTGTVNGGMFRLSLGPETTGAIAWNAPADKVTSGGSGASVQEKLEMFSAISAVAVSAVSGAGGTQVWSVTFARTAGDVGQITLHSSQLTGATPAVVTATATQGNFLDGTFAVRFEGSKTSEINSDATSGDMAAALATLPGIGGVDVTRSNGPGESSFVWSVTFGSSAHPTNLGTVPLMVPVAECADGVAFRPCALIGVGRSSCR